MLSPPRASVRGEAGTSCDELARFGSPWGGSAGGRARVASRFDGLGSLWGGWRVRVGGCALPIGRGLAQGGGGGPAVHSTRLRAPDFPGLETFPLPFAVRLGLGGWGQALGVKATGSEGLGITSVWLGDWTGSSS